MAKMRRLVKTILLAGASLLLSFLFILGVIFTYIEVHLPNVEKLKDVHLQVPLRIYSADDKLIAQYGSKRRMPVSLASVPKPLVKAILATEDSRYYEHPGVDFIGLVRAAVAVITSGRKVQGASTITMQVVRNFYLSREKTFIRKAKEILLALKIDQELSKDKILELYLNKIYFGNRAYGVAAAADVYYGKKLDQLTLAEMAMLAGLPQAPSRNNPIDNPMASMKRRNHVLSRMMDLKLISEQQFTAAIKLPVSARYHGNRIQLEAPYLAEMVREAMVKQYGSKAYEKGFSVYTTVTQKRQTAATRALRGGLLAYDQRHGFRRPQQGLGVFEQKRWQTQLKKQRVSGELIPAGVVEIQQDSIRVMLANAAQVTIPWSGLAWARPALEDGSVGALPEKASDIVRVGDVIFVRRGPDSRWRLSQLPAVQGALVSINPKTGALLALSGGFDYRVSNFNRAIQAARQPGSNFKPFIYSSALARGFTLATVINDAPIVQVDTGENQLWRPMNDTMRFYGPTSLRLGLIKSRNLVSIRLLQSIGIPYTLDYLKRFGFDPSTLPQGLSLALGSGLTTPLQIAVGYAVFANGGFLVAPYFIDKIVDQYGTVTYKAEPVKACPDCFSKSGAQSKTGEPRAKRVITPQNCYLMNSALREVVQFGTARRAKVLHREDIAGKTGTTNQQVDAWFSGFNRSIVTTVWVGFDNMKSLREYGARAALPIWIDYMRVALQETPTELMSEPPGMVTVRIDPRTGLLASPSDSDAKFEIFRQQYAPHQYSEQAPAETALAAKQIDDVTESQRIF